MEEEFVHNSDQRAGGGFAPDDETAIIFGDMRIVFCGDDSRHIIPTCNL